MDKSKQKIPLIITKTEGENGIVSFEVNRFIDMGNPDDMIAIQRAGLPISLLAYAYNNISLSENEEKRINRMALLITLGIAVGIFAFLLYLSFTPYNIYGQLFVIVVFSIFIGNKIVRYVWKRFDKKK